MAVTILTSPNSPLKNYFLNIVNLSSQTYRRYAYIIKQHKKLTNEKNPASAHRRAGHSFTCIHRLPKSKRIS
jgi:hypothetical protein